MVSSSTRKWLGSIALAGLVLASSLPALASTQLKVTENTAPMQPLLVVSSIIPSETYTQALRKQMQWSEPIKTNISVESSSSSETLKATLAKPSAVVQKTTQPIKTAQTKKVEKPKSNPKPVQVAAAPKQQVSRSNSSTLVNNALSLQGVPYVFGGTSKSGFDCSGYTQYVYKGSDISLPRTSFEQFNVGSSITKEQLQTGDLVFFTTYQKGPSHVGIYIGGGNFVHASNSGVRTTSLNDSYYAGRYVGARRI